MDLSHQDLQGADLREVNLQRARLCWTDLRRTDLYKADLRKANLQEANLRGTDLREVTLSGTNLREVNFSGTKGLLNPYSWLLKNFERRGSGFIVYKNFGVYYLSPPNWTIKEGETIREASCPDRTIECSFGINFATLRWHHRRASEEIWECLLGLEGLSTLVVPYNTDGKARTGCLRLLRKRE